MCFRNLLTTGELNRYLSDTNKPADNTFFRLVKELTEKESVTEKLKAENQMLLVQNMNNIRNYATEVVNTDLIFV